MSVTVSSPVRQRVQVLLDGAPIDSPENCRSLGGVRAHLEAVALKQHRIVYAFNVDGRPGDVQRLGEDGDFFKVEAETVALDEMPLYLLSMAIHQLNRAYAQALSATDVLVTKDCCVAREFWWDLSASLRQPLLTLSLIPESKLGQSAGASQATLRKWQFEQLGAIISDLNEACWSNDVNVLRNALWARVIPWIESLQRSLDLLNQGMMGAAAFAM
jgi:hypothetical protein